MNLLEHEHQKKVTAGAIREIRIDIISKMVLDHLFSNEYRCYLRPAKNGFPIDYAQTFKIVKIKKREKVPPLRKQGRLEREEES